MQLEDDMWKMACEIVERMEMEDIMVELSERIEKVFRDDPDSFFYEWNLDNDNLHPDDPQRDCGQLL